MSLILTNGGESSPNGNFTDFYYNYYETCGMEALPDFVESKAADAIQLFLYPVLLCLATLGNLSSLILLKQLSVHAWSSCLYLAVLSLIDLVLLYIRCGGEWMTKVANKNPSAELMNLSDAMCKTYLFCINVLLQMWPWLIVALAVELAISMRYPLKIYHVCTTERARAAVLLITILLVCLNLNFFWTWGIRDVQGTTVCMYIEEFSMEFMNTIWPGIEMCVKHLLPLLAVIACLIVILLSFQCCRGGGRGPVSYEPILKRYFLDLQALQQLQSAALVLVIVFLIVKAYTFIVEVIYALDMREFITVTCEDRPVFTARITLVRVIRDASVYCFWSLKFFVYFACCASFRKRFYCIIKRISRCCRKKDEKKEEAAIEAAKNNATNMRTLEHSGNSGGGVISGGSGVASDPVVGPVQVNSSEQECPNTEDSRTTKV